MARVGFMVMMVALVKSIVDDLLLLVAENIAWLYVRVIKLRGQYIMKQPYTQLFFSDALCTLFPLHGPAVNTSKGLWLPFWGEITLHHCPCPRIEEA